MTLRALVRLSFFEFLRDRIVWMGCFVAVLMFLFSMVLGSLSFNEQQRILAHLGWSAIQLSTLVMSLILSANWLQKEMDRQTCLLVLARPVTRAQFLLGKYLPIFLLTFALQLALAFCLLALLGFTFSPLHFLAVFYGTFLEVAMAFSVCFFFATFMRPTLAFFMGFSVFLIGHWIQEIEFFGHKYKISVYENVAQLAKWLLPNLFQYNWRSVYFLENGVSQEQILWVTLHAAGWLMFLVLSSILVFRRKDLV
jgi:ABC-type transport system involved in multi-copper enzyme maturation permease subunit